jgi:hypothetical protein
MRRALDAGANSLSLRFAGAFTTTDALNDAGRRGFELTQQLLDRTKAAGALRADIEVGDLHLLFEQLQVIQVADAQRTTQLRHRYLTLLLDALHTRTGPPLPGPPPSWQEIRNRYDSR